MLSTHINYDELFSLNNILHAWRKFRRGKVGKIDILNFELHLEDNLFELYNDFVDYSYEHSSYQYFQVFDSKKRDIYKAEVRDRIIHQIVYEYLVRIFESDFISDSYASRISKGQYKAIKTARYFSKLASSEGKQCYILKCDVRKYFAQIDQNALLLLIRKKVFDDKILTVISKIIFSYSPGNLFKGIPLGNVTSQIFANIYLNSLDYYVKMVLRCRFYVRYNDDIIIFSHSPRELQEIRQKIIKFVSEELSLEIPLEKTSLRKLNWGVDFLGLILLPEAILLRNKTKAKIYANINPKNKYSYLSILGHCCSSCLRRRILAVEKLNRICYDTKEWKI